MHPDNPAANWTSRRPTFSPLSVISADETGLTIFCTMESFEDWARSSTLASVEKHADALIELGAFWDTFRGETDATIDDLVDGGIPRLAARDICRIASEAIKRSEAPLSVFWDLENVPLPTSVSGTQAAARLKSIVAPHGRLKQFRGYASIGLNLIPEQKRSELQLSGCHLVDCPHNGRKEVADKMIIVDAMEFAFTHPEGATLCFVTGDVDYAYLLAKLQKPMWRTIVISKGSLQSMLHVNCDMKMRWETDVLQLRSSPPRIPPPPGFGVSACSQVEASSGIAQASALLDVPLAQTFLGAVAVPNTITTPSKGFVDSAESTSSSLEALTRAEEWTDDAELLRAIVTQGSQVGGSSPGTLKSHVGICFGRLTLRDLPIGRLFKLFFLKPLRKGS